MMLPTATSIMLLNTKAAGHYDPLPLPPNVEYCGARVSTIGCTDKDMAEEDEQGEWVLPIVKAVAE